MSNNRLQDYIEETLTPAMFERLNEVFPEMKFTRVGTKWLSPLKPDLSQPSTPRRDKTVVRSQQPTKAIEAGADRGISLFDLYMSINGVDFMGAVKGISSTLGLSVPEREDSEEYRAYRERLEKMQEIASTMQRDLQGDAGSEVLSYLRDRRGYSDEFIAFASLGFVSRESAKELSRIFEGTGAILPYGLGDTHTLAIPYRTGGNIKGFVFRTVSDTVTNKYTNVFISRNETKKHHLFGLTGLRLTGNREKDRDIVVVEGELDALRAQFAGLENVVAASGGILSSEALAEAKKRGVNRVTVLYDREETEASRQKLTEKIVGAIRSIGASGLRAMVALFPDGIGKMDADTYLRDHSGEELQAIIDNAESGALYLYRKYLHEAIEATPGGEDGAPTDRTIEELKRKTLELVNDATICSPTDADTILVMLSESTNGQLTKESLNKEAENARLIENAKRQSSLLRTSISEALRMSDAGNEQKAIEFLHSRLDDIKEIQTEERYRRLFSIETEDELLQAFKERRAGVATDLYFGGSRFYLPSGALTYVCAPTSHGKTRLLENMALSISDNGEAGETLFFSYEEDATAIRLQMLNIYTGITLTNGRNRETINEYYKSGSRQYFKGGTFEVFKERESRFLQLMTSGRLRVIYEPLGSDELTGAIRYAARHGRIKAVFIDYVQLIHKEGSRKQRKDELKDICNDLMALSVETGVPIVLGAQLNREALSPLEMTVQNIAEASDIEQSANVVMLLWNSVVKPLPRSTVFYSDRATLRLSKEAEELTARGFNIGQEGKLYAILAKNRGGERNIDAVFDYDGNIGTIKTPESEKGGESGTAVQQDIIFDDR